VLGVLVLLQAEDGGRAGLLDQAVDLPPPARLRPHDQARGDLVVVQAQLGVVLIRVTPAHALAHEGVVLVGARGGGCG